MYVSTCTDTLTWSSSERVNLLLQNSHEQMKGRSPECHLRCARRCEVLPYILLQPGMWQTCTFFLLSPPRSPSLQLGQVQATRRSRVLPVSVVGESSGCGTTWVWFTWPPVDTTHLVPSFSPCSPLAPERHQSDGLESLLSMPLVGTGRK